MTEINGEKAYTTNLHMRNGMWTVQQMARIFKALDMGAEDACIVLGVRK